MENSLHVEQVEEAAAAWLLKRESPQWSPADDAELTEWLKASTNHRVAYLRLRSVWQEAGRLRVVSTGFPPGQVPPRGAMAQTAFFSRKPSSDPKASASVRLSGSTVKFHGLAASLFLAAALGMGAYFFWPSDASTYHTPIGGLAIVPMDDGSKITLNTNSEITLGENDKERRVHLARGEAFFDVAKDPTRPFVVYANDQRVIAVGTKFAVRLKPETVQVAVTEGQVRLEKRPSRLMLPGKPPEDLRTVSGRYSPLLIAGTLANAKGQDVSLQQQSLAEVEQSLSWRTGYVVLRKAFLSEAVTEFNRYNRRELVIDDPALADIQVGGNFRSNNIDGFVRLLQEGFQIHAEEKGNRIILSGRSRAE